MYMNDKKDYPENYTNEIRNIIKMISFSRGAAVSIAGSMSLKTQLYAQDVDAYEKVSSKLSSTVARQFQEIIKQLLNTTDIIISDIKLGSIDDWQVVSPNITIKDNKVIGYNMKKSLEKLDELKENNIISGQDYIKYKQLLKKNPSPEEYFSICDEIRPNIIRWKATDILNGYINLSNNTKLTLEAAIESPTIAKLDVITYLRHSCYTDVSIIYEFKINGKLVNPPNISVEQSLKEDILYYYLDHKYFKMAKRMYALARLKKYKLDMQTLTDIFNSDLGRLYSISADVATLTYLIDNHKNYSQDKLIYELDQFIGRISNINNLTHWKQKEKSINNILDYLIHNHGNKHSKPEVLKELNEIETYCNDALTQSSKEVLTKAGLLPVPNQYLP